MKCPLALCPKPDMDFANTTSLYRHFVDKHPVHIIAGFLAHHLFKGDIE